jgi:MFS family permease
MIAAFYLGGGASLLLTALVTGVWQLAAALTLVGVFSAIYHPVGTAMLASVAGPSGRTFGLNGVFGNLGVAAAPLVTGLIVEALGWRWAFVLPGLVMLGLGIAFLMAVPPDAGKAAKHASAAARPPNALDLRFIAIVIGITVFAGGFTFNTVTIALPKFVVERSTDAGVSLSQAGFIASGIYLVGAATQLIVGRLVDRFSSGSIFLVLATFQVAGFAGMAILEGPAALATAGLVLASVYGQVVVNDLIIARSVPDRFRSRDYAMRYMLGFAVAAAVVPLI